MRLCMKESKIAVICKALGDENRVQIIKMLTGEELYACKILDAFNITQSTLSHHMKHGYVEEVHMKGVYKKFDSWYDLK